MNSLQFGIPSKTLDALAGTTATSGTEYALPGRGTSAITWQSIFSSAPDAVSLALQASLDGSTWHTIDTSTNVAGEVKTINSSTKFIRGRLVSKTAGGTTTIIINCQSFQIGIVAGSIFDFVLDSLISDGTVGQVLTTDGVGGISFEDSGGGNPFDQDLNTTDPVEFLSVTTDLLEASGAEIVVGSVIKFMTDVNLNGVNVATGSAEIGTTGDRLNGLWTDDLNGVNISAGVAVQGTAVAFTSVTVDSGSLFRGASSAGGSSTALQAGVSLSGAGNDVQVSASAGFDDLVTLQPGGNVLLNPGPGVNGGANGIVLIGDSLVAPIVRIATGGRFVSTAVDTETAGLAVYDVNGAVYRDFLVWTNGNAPAVAMTIPTTGTLTIEANNVKSTLQTAENSTTGLTAGVLAALTNASIVITDGTGQVYRVPCII